MAAVARATVGVIGLGAVGGSFAKAVLRAGFHVRAHAASRADRDAARRAGLMVTDDIRGCVAGAGLVLVAVPMTEHAAVASAVVGAAGPGALLLHAASLQSARAIAAAAGDAAGAYRGDAPRRVIGTHPLAGSHRSGFDAADADLFAGCTVSIEERADASTREAAEALWGAAGAARFEYRTAEEHDDLMTWVSHLPQLASTALAHAIASAGVSASALGPGGRDVTRLASSPFEMWAGILAGGRPGAARAAAALERSVGALRLALETADMARVADVWAAARAWRAEADGDRAGTAAPSAQ